MTLSQYEKSYLLNQGHFDYICPVCKYSKSIKVKNNAKINHKLKVRIRCKCGHVDIAFLERRNRYRKVTKLKGRIFCTDKNSQRISETINIVNISADGMAFEIIDPQNCILETGKTISITFQVNEMADSSIRKEAFIINKNENRINVKFKDNSPKEEKICFKIFLYSLFA